MESNNITYGQMLVKIRAKKAWTQKQLARKLNCARTMVSMMENENREPGSVLQYKITELYQKTVLGLEQIKFRIF